MWVYYRSCYQIAMIAMMLGSLSACLVGPDFETPQPPKVNHYTNPPWPCRTVSAPGRGGGITNVCSMQNLFSRMVAFISLAKNE